MNHDGQEEEEEGGESLIKDLNRAPEASLAGDLLDRYSQRLLPAKRCAGAGQ